MTDNKSDLRAGHRERLRKNFLDNKLAKYETLELLLTYAIPRKDVRPLARTLYKRFGGMFGILSASIDDLCSVNGMGYNTAIFIKVIQKVMLDGYESNLTEAQIFHNDEQFINYCKLMLGKKHVEEVHVLYMDDVGRLIENQLHSVGTYDYSALYGIEVVKHAIAVGAKSVALVHNHPREQTSFSSQDQQLTEELQRQLNAVGIKLIDHCVVSGHILYSMRKFGLIH